MPCQLERAENAAGGNSAAPRVVVELATLTGDVRALDAALPRKNEASSTTAESASGLPFLDDPHLRIPSVANLMLTNSQPLTIPWGPALTSGKDGCPLSAQSRLSLTARMAPVQPRSVSLEITIAPTPEGAVAASALPIPEQCRSHTTLVLRDQQSVLLGGFTDPKAQAEQSLLVLTPYIIWNESDMRGLLECKAKLAREERSKATGG